MKRTFLLIATVAIFVVSASAQLKLNADTTKSKLVWLGEKVTGQHTGTIKLQSGWISMQDNKIVSGEFNIDMNSLKETDKNARLEGHMKSDDFFGVLKYPVAKLVITGSSSFEKGNGTVDGKLTIKDTTNPITFKAALQKNTDGTWFYANIVIDRTKYNVRYGSGSFFENLGDKTIYDDFSVKVNLLVR